MQKHPAITLERVEKFLSHTYWTDVNLSGVKYRARTSAVVSLHMFSPEVVRPPFSEALKGEYRPVAAGQTIGPSWSSHWFRVDISLPTEDVWSGGEVHLLWDSDCEALVYSSDGKPLQGLTGGNGHDKRHEYVLNPAAAGGEVYCLYVEAACNGMFGVGGGGMIWPPDPARTFTLKTAEVAVLDPIGSVLYAEVSTLYDLAKQQPTTTLGRQSLYVANAIVNTFRRHDRDTWTACRQLAAEVLGCKGSPAGTLTRDIVHAVGNCHIDTAWLWPFDETRRKVTRSWATAVEYLRDEKYPSYTFAASQAQQFAWLKADSPELFSRIQAAVTAGRFIPVGGAWVEMDANIPSGESIVRQLLYGQAFFQEEFGVHSQVFWLPDTFGYAAQFPQIIRGAGMKYFMTQKLSWSLINKHPHTSFRWRGLDGSTVLTHFPPADTYNGSVSVEEVLRCVSNNKDADRAPVSLLLYGNGDGGGGPTREMIDRVDMLGDVDTLPIVQHSTPDAFFAALEAMDERRPLCTWDGELYLELHQGTFTSQAAGKKFNRYCEVALHSLEFCAALFHIGGFGTAVSPSVSVSLPWPLPVTAGIGSKTTVAEAVPMDHTLLASALLPDSLQKEFWRHVLLCQFHDVLPGSSIEMVHVDATTIQLQCLKGLLSRLAAATLAITAVDSPQAIQFSGSWSTVRTDLLSPVLTQSSTITGLNCASVDRYEIVVVPNTWPVPSAQTSYDGNNLVCVRARAYGAVEIMTTPATPSPPVVTVEDGPDYIRLTNQYMTVDVSKSNGTITRLCHIETGREVVSPSRPVNTFTLYDDVPFYWDAWDVMPYHLETAAPVSSVGVDVKVVETGPLRAIVSVDIPSVGKASSIHQLIILTAVSQLLEFETAVEWREARTMLKVEFPVNIRCTDAAFETQFGWLRRPTTTNTSWDVAKYEVCGHRWADMSESGFGVALLNDCKYGYSCRDGKLALSLLRSPKAPDAHCDMGPHTMRFALFPHTGAFPTPSVVEAAVAFNTPLALVPAHPDSIPSGSPYFTASSSTPGCMPLLDTVKLSEMDTKVVIFRVYEALGGRGQCILTSRFPITSVGRTNLLEQALPSDDIIVSWDKECIRLNIQPFQILSLRVTF